MAIKLGILGAGGEFVQGFIPLFKAHPLVGEIVLCDHVAEKLAASAARHGIARTVASYDELLASGVDAVAIFTQNATGLRYAFGNGPMKSRKKDTSRM